MILNMYHIELTLCMNYNAQTGNTVTEFTHSKCIAPSYYSSPAPVTQKQSQLISSVKRNVQFKDHSIIVLYTADYTAEPFTPYYRPQKFTKIMFYTCVSVHSEGGVGGVVSQHALEVVSQHALQVSR